MMHVKKIINLSIVSLLLITGFSIEAAPVIYTDTEGRAIQLSEVPKQWVILNYWASWCKPCFDEIPEINAFYRRQKKNEVILLGVNYDAADQKTLKQLIIRMGIKFPVLTTDPANELGIDTISVLPATYIFSPAGKLVKKLYGGQTQKRLEEVMAELKGESVS